MQEKSKIFYKTIANLIRRIKAEKSIKYTELCYENDIPTSTYDDIVNARNQAKFHDIAKIINGLGISFEEFGALLDKELPNDLFNSFIE